MSLQRRPRSLFATSANVYLMLALTLLMTALHITWLPLLTAPPDLMLVLMVAWSLLRGIEEGLLWAFVGGVLLDLLSGGPFGAFTLALLLAALLAGAVHRAAFSATLLQVAVMALATFIYHVAYALVLATAVRPDWGFVSSLIGPALAWNVALLVLGYRPLIWLSRRTGGSAVRMP